MHINFFISELYIAMRIDLYHTYISSYICNKFDDFAISIAFFRLIELAIK